MHGKYTDMQTNTQKHRQTQTKHSNTHTQKKTKDKYTNTSQTCTHTNTTQTCKHNIHTGVSYEVEMSRCGTTLPPAGARVKFSSESRDIIESSQSSSTETGGREMSKSVYDKILKKKLNQENSTTK